MMIAFDQVKSPSLWPECLGNIEIRTDETDIDDWAANFNCIDMEHLPEQFQDRILVFVRFADDGSDTLNNQPGIIFTLSTLIVSFGEQLARGMIW